MINVIAIFTPSASISTKVFFCLLPILPCTNHIINWLLIKELKFHVVYSYQQPATAAYRCLCNLTKDLHSIEHKKTMT